MYTIKTITPPAAEPVTVDELKAQMRVSTGVEDDLFAAYITSAREMFEALTLRAVMTTTFRQHCPYLTGPIYLMRGEVQTIDSVKYYDVADQLQTASGYYTDTISTPSSVFFLNYPNVSTYKSPVAYVDFTAGWEADQVPAMVKTAIRLLAAHYYEYREAFGTDNLNELPMGFKAVCDQYKLGLQGNWHATERTDNPLFYLPG